MDALVDGMLFEFFALVADEREALLVLFEIFE